MAGTIGGGAVACCPSQTASAPVAQAPAAQAPEGCPVGKPDLVVDKLYFVDENEKLITSSTQGQPINGFFTIKNQGKANVAEDAIVTTNMQLTRDSFEKIDELSFIIGGNELGTGKTSAKASIGAFTPQKAGKYCLNVQIDADKTVDESDEQNNNVLNAACIWVKGKCTSDNDCNQDEKKGPVERCKTDIGLCVPKSLCKPLDPAKIGDTKNKIDLAFIAEGEDWTEEELRSTTIKLLGDDSSFGLFSIEPLKSNRNKFNIWIYFPEKTFLDPNAFSKKTGINDNVQSAIKITKKCAKAEFFVTLSKSYFKPIARSSDNIGFISLAFKPSKLGNVFTHEIGHSIFGLADEYVKDGLHPKREQYPNCALDQNTAETWWGDLVKAKVEGVSYFYGCNFNPVTIRPTEDSIMNEKGEFSDSPTFGPVNSRHIEKRLSKYS